MRINKVSLEKKAMEFRLNNGLSLIEPIHLKNVLQQNNILTVFLGLGDSFSGMAVKINDGVFTKRFILVNSNHTIGRQHFTICHELYHLYFQENFKSAVSKQKTFDPKGDPEEYKADLFASYLLLPDGGIKSLIPDEEYYTNKITLKTILAIEQYYSCSRSALLNRLKDLNLIDNKVMLNLSENITKNAILYGYNTTLYKKGNEGIVIGDYGPKARELFDKGIISESSYFSLLEDIGKDLSEIDNQTDNE